MEVYNSYDSLCEQARWTKFCTMIGYNSRQDGTTLPAQDYPVSQKKIVLFFHIMNPLFTKLVQLRLLDISLVLFFCMFMDLDSILVYKDGQYPAILTSCLVNNQYVQY